MENQRIKLRLEDIKVESFVTNTGWDVNTIKGRNDTNARCDQAHTSEEDMDCLAGGTNTICTGKPVCNSNTACWDASCADGSWCCPSIYAATDCNTCATCGTGCQSCPC